MIQVYGKVYFVLKNYFKKEVVGRFENERSIFGLILGYLVSPTKATSITIY